MGLNISITHDSFTNSDAGMPAVVVNHNPENSSSSSSSNSNVVPDANIPNVSMQLPLGISRNPDANSSSNEIQQRG